MTILNANIQQTKKVRSSASQAKLSRKENAPRLRRFRSNSGAVCEAVVSLPVLLFVLINGAFLMILAFREVMISNSLTSAGSRASLEFTTASPTNIAGWLGAKAPVAFSVGVCNGKQGSTCAVNQNQASSPFSWMTFTASYVNKVGPFTINHSKSILYRAQFNGYSDLPS